MNNEKSAPTNRQEPQSSRLVVYMLEDENNKPVRGPFRTRATARRAENASPSTHVHPYDLVRREERAEGGA